jgi:hypothetical protein
MKIERDLRMAINAVARAQKPSSWEQRHQANAKAVKDLFTKNPALKKKLTQLQKKREQLLKQVGAINAQFDDVGLNYKLDTFHTNDDGKKAFVKAGGVLPPVDKRSWKADEVINLLTLAEDQKTFDKILKQYGIVWK